MKLKIIKRPKLSQPLTFSNNIWLTKGTPEDVLYAAKQNNLTCVCYLSTTPIQSSIWFHVKEVQWA